jgi:hypothetical protein
MMPVTFVLVVLSWLAGSPVTTVQEFTSMERCTVASGLINQWATENKTNAEAFCVLK